MFYSLFPRPCGIVLHFRSRAEGRSFHGGEVSEILSSLLSRPYVYMGLRRAVLSGALCGLSHRKGHRTGQVVLKNQFRQAQKDRDILRYGKRVDIYKYSESCGDKGVESVFASYPHPALSYGGGAFGDMFCAVASCNEGGKAAGRKRSDDMRLI